MVIKQVKWSDLRVNDRYVLSFPPRPELYKELTNQFFDFPLLVVNPENEIISGIDFYYYLKSLGNPGGIDVLQGHFNDTEALFLNYNLKNKFCGLNLYEKLIFVKKITPLAGKPEIYKKTNLDVTINRELLDKLDRVTGSEFMKILTGERVALKSALRLCDFGQADRTVLIELFDRVYFSASQQLKILEMTEEIVFRDKCPLQEVFGKLDVERCFEEEKPQKKIIDAVFKYRFPIYSEKEKEWQQELKDLKLPGNIKISHYPFFEKKQADVHISVPDAGELKKIILKISS